MLLIGNQYNVTYFRWSVCFATLDTCASAAARTQQLGEWIFPRVTTVLAATRVAVGGDASKLTGMLLDMPELDLLELIDAPLQRVAVVVASAHEALVASLGMPPPRQLL